MSSSTNSSPTSPDEAAGTGLQADGAPTESFTEPLAPTDAFPVVEPPAASLAAVEPATEPLSATNPATEPLDASPAIPGAPDGAVWSASSVRGGMRGASASATDPAEAGPGTPGIGATTTTPGTASATGASGQPGATSARPQTGRTFDTRHGWRAEEPVPWRRASTGTIIWGILLLALGGLTIAAGVGLRVDLQLATIGVLGVLGVVLLILAILPHRDRMGRP
ncbi:hypothetical protein [Actinomyces gaoshouyii]|uniref:Uncharacterized protein n=1 Tax=Actinomyces gaoshouyii TaxID=1960083 RepID=A0A8H9HAK5_9ACTO|nr:hypothetical protein [Actinomyces gaoshouyii]ARD42076.1 hypothetical protein B6G06_06760 [Actinomyces gaoshouyii]GGO96662.1 hypothetical protein GCM10011612_07410 [Actinomyces gaoshouyii]